MSCASIACVHVHVCKKSNVFTTNRVVFVPLFFLRCMECVSMAQAQLKDKDVRDHSEHLKVRPSFVLTVSWPLCMGYRTATIDNIYICDRTR